ncbi:hypothetical protein F4802DRAFT_606845 [Xylaria palmicola]|nr:hypothetical protein F4802DRAFT_606845 [Xylaria palmicola]
MGAIFKNTLQVIVWLEIALARSAIVLWDDCEISWEWIGLAAALIRTNFDMISNLFQTQSRLRTVDLSDHMGIINAYFMFRLSRSQSYIPRLHFSFHEILKLTSTIVPDYSKSVAEVYCLVAKRFIESSSSLTILSSPFDWTMPSWRTGIFYLLSQRFQRKDTNNPLKLEVRGMIIDAILLQNPLDSRRFLEKIALTLTAGQDWYGLPVQDSSTHLTLEKDAFVTESDWTVYSKYVPGPETMAALESLIRQWQLEDQVKDGSSISFLDAAATISSRRARFTTGRGMIGIGPMAMKRGDLLCVLYGADVPFIIRRRTVGPGCILIGECYVYDLTSGDGARDSDEAASEVGHDWIQGEKWIELF